MADASSLFGGPIGGVVDAPKKRGRKAQSERNGVDGSIAEDRSAGNEVDSGGSGIDGSQEAAGGEAGAQDPISPEAAIGGEEPVKKRRGRKPGSTVKSKESAGKLALDPKHIQGLHVVLAKLTGQPIFEINDFEATLLANSIADVSQHYNLAASSKTMAIIGLIGTAGIVYFPRIVEVRRQRRKPVGPAPLFPDMPVSPPQEARPKGVYNFDETAH